jgi:two-component system, OmpR family, phosphate regulon response regulator PhoB
LSVQQVHADADLTGMGTPSEQERRPTVLVCDDEDALRYLVRATLGSRLYNIVEAADGEEALACFRSHRPDLLLLDAMMPGRSGSEVLAELRRDPVTAATPVIMLTASVESDGQAGQLAPGANYYHAKPFSPVLLAAVVREALARP